MGKVQRIIVTGASGAMGEAAVRALAREGRSVVMACRNPEKADAVRSRILADLPGSDISIGRLDLASLDSVRAFVDGVGTEPVSALFNNAGVISRSYSLTGDGLENTFAVNYFGPFLLTRLLLPVMEPDASIVNMVSLTCRYVSVTEESLRPEEKDFSQLGTYARSKLALLRFSLELARRNPGLHVNLADPGIVNSNMIDLGHWYDPLADILFRPFCKSPERGVQPALSALASDAHNRYFVGKKNIDIPERFNDPDWDLRIWEETERILSL
ncbi:MAG: SDR family NAD(P)-dependent oxidoreductase [Bacteroidales bacterium]|nr:SDR family NAD(P)-dependent oxidoreductase [Bacteroidales bacterium]